MGRSLSLAAYRALSWRRAHPAPEIVTPRPKGELLWIHATSQERCLALANLAERLKSQRPGLSVLASSNKAQPGLVAKTKSGSFQVIASDHPASVRQFLDHWQPDICLWAGGDFLPNLISDAAEQSVPMVLLDLGAGEFPYRSRRWFPDLTWSTVDCFDAILTRDQATATLIGRGGLPEDRIRVTSQLRTVGTPPYCPDEDLVSTSSELASRPVWLAAGVQASEIGPLLTAHRIALRFVHRLLLVVALARPEDLFGLKAVLTGSGLRFGDWDEGARISEDLQVMVSTDPADLGLWYRLSPVSFVASTLDCKPGGRSPFEAAALGSAVLHGPDTRGFEEPFASLDSQGAAEVVHDPDQLGAAVIRLSAPDQAADMALAGWKVVTEGAQLTDDLINLAQDMLDARESSRARP